MYNNEIEIDVFRCLNALRKNVRFIIVITILFMIAGVFLNLKLKDNKYSATATVYAAADSSYSEATNAVSAMNAYMDVAKSYKVCQRAALLLGRTDIEPEDIMESIYISSSEQDSALTASLAKATVINFTATSTDEDLSIEMANAVAQAYALEMYNILHVDSVKVLDDAYKTYKSFSGIRSAAKKIILLSILGFMFACFVVVVSEIFDKKVRTLRDATIRDNIPIIGVIPDYKE